MKPPRLPLPPDVAPLVASVKRSSDPPDEVRTELRARLGWAFMENGPTKVVYAPERQPLHAVPQPARRAPRLDRWFVAMARAAAALVLGHVPLALASLGIAVAAVPVAKVLLSRVADENRATVHPTTQRQQRVAHPRPARTPDLSAPPVPSLAPPPAPFPADEPVAPKLQAATQPLSDRLTPSAPAAVPGDDLTLAAERQLLGQARLALVRGDPLGALASLNEHGARYPGSQLAEEREALSIQAFLGAGRVGEARLRGVAFRHRYPKSLLLPALDAALHE
jgi:hypothetical protein